MSVEQRSMHILCASWGRNEQGALGLGAKMARNKKVDVITKPHAMHSLFGKSIQSISCGYRHSAAVLQNGKVYMWGKDTLGSLGLGFDVQIAPQPTPLEGLWEKGIRGAEISCGESSTALLDDTGKVFVWGWKRADDVTGYIGDESFEEEPIRLDTGDLRVRRIRCGWHCFALIDMEGDLYMWGEGTGGRLGNENDHNVNLPKKVQSLPPDEQVIDVQLGKTFTIALTEYGNVYVWGTGKSGELGLGVGVATAYVPTPMDLTQFEGEVTAISSFGMHTCILTNEGCVYTFGVSDNFRLGYLEETGAVWVPTQVPGVYNATSISAGLYTTCTILGDEDSSCIAWGGLSEVDEEHRVLSIHCRYVSNGGFCSVVYKGLMPQSKVPHCPKLPEDEHIELDDAIRTFDLDMGYTKEDVKRHIVLINQALGNALYTRDMLDNRIEQKRQEIERIRRDPLTGAQVQFEFQLLNFRMQTAVENGDDRQWVRSKHDKAKGYEENPDQKSLRDYIVFKY